MKANVISFAIIIKYMLAEYYVNIRTHKLVHVVSKMNFVQHVNSWNYERLIHERMRNVPGIGVTSAGFALTELLLGKFSSLSLLISLRSHGSFGVSPLFPFCRTKFAHVDFLFFDINPPPFRVLFPSDTPRQHTPLTKRIST